MKQDTHSRTVDIAAFQVTCVFVQVAYSAKNSFSVPFALYIAASVRSFPFLCATCC